MKMLRPRTAKEPQPGTRTHGGDERHKLYTGSRWRRLRAQVLAREPLCRSCAARGFVQVAGVVDHIAGHAGNWRQRFFDPNNLQPLCRACHDEKTKAELAQKARGVPAFENSNPANSRRGSTTLQSTERKEP